MLITGTLALAMTACSGGGAKGDAPGGAETGTLEPGDSGPRADDSGGHTGDTGHADAGDTATNGETGGFEDSGPTVDSGGDDTGELEIPTGDWAYVSAGYQGTCGIHDDGTLECWGSDEDGTISETPEGGFAAVSLGGAYACAVALTGEIECWGHDVRTDPVQFSGSYQIVAITDSGEVYALAADGTVDTSGECSDAYECGDAPSGTFVSLSAGGDNGCVLAADGSLQCWGGAEYKELGEVPGGTYSAVACASYVGANCAITTAGDLTCWGSDAADRSSWAEYNLPTGTFAQVSVGGMYGCALDESGYASCWRHPGWEDISSVVYAEPPAYPFVSISAGNLHVCGITTLGGMVCWGSDIEGSTVPPS